MSYTQSLIKSGWEGDCPGEYFQDLLTDPEISPARRIELAELLRDQAKEKIAMYRRMQSHAHQQMSLAEAMLKRAEAALAAQRYE